MVCFVPVCSEGVDNGTHEKENQDYLHRFDRVVYRLRYAVEEHEGEKNMAG